MNGTFLILGMVAAAALTGPARGGGSAAIKFGVCDWTLGKAGDPAAFRLAGSLGLDGVQVSLVPRGDSLRLADPGERKAFLEAARASGVAIASFALGDLNEVPLKSDPRAERWLEQALAIAPAMGVRIILVPFFGKGDIKNDPAGTAAVIAALRRLAPQAERAGAVLALESWLSAEDHLTILEAVGSPAVRVYYDVGNSQDAGYDIVREIGLLGRRICEFHAKDTRDLYGKGSMDFRRVRRAMEEIGYAGWFVLEGTKLPLGVEASLRYDIEHLKTVFQ
jgi:sugar phosphate isomerase/epimerase